MNTKEYVALQVEQTRGQLRAAAFIRMTQNSLCLMGKRLDAFVADLVASGKKPIELVDAVPALAGEQPYEGDIVSVDNVFSDREGMIWDGTEIKFQTPEGAIVTPNQYEYLKTNRLCQTQIFAETSSPIQGVSSVWKSISRVSHEARADKAKEILYLTVGVLAWSTGDGKKGVVRVNSPLFLLPIREENTAGNLAKIKVTQPILKQNSVLKREVQKQTGINIYENCMDEIPLADIASGVEAVMKTVNESIGGMSVVADAFYICILDSHNEGLCQAVEKNMDAIAGAKLTQVMAGELPETELPDAASVAAAIFPLAADESQQKVIRAVLKGRSVYSPAPAGAGKSQTSVNIAANLAIRGRSVCIMSEKLAANEVFLNYAGKIGLDKFCLSVNSNMKTADIVRQLKAIARVKRQYVHTERAKETVRLYTEAKREYEKLMRDLYRTEKDINISLYELISQAVAGKELSKFEAGAVTRDRFLPLRAALLDLRRSCFDIMGEDEFYDYFYRNGTCDDPELRQMLESKLLAVQRLGLNVPTLITENKLKLQNATDRILSSVSRALAMEIIEHEDLLEVGNRKVKAVYKALADSYLQMQQLYISYVKQELTATVHNHLDEKFIETLEKLRVTKVSPQELFRAYGKEIGAICPIIVTTPAAASDYLYGTGLDHFDTMIIDEASQMQIISVLPYMDRVGQLVVFGDSMQLGITTVFMKKDVVVDADTVKDTAYTDRSVLDAVQGRFEISGLRYHYRSETEMLIHVSNKTCYDGMLEIAPDVYTKKEALPNHLGLEVIQVDNPIPNPKGGNEAEALAIADRVAALQMEYPEKSIGIIAFNEKQQDLISDKLEEKLKRFTDGERLWVRSLENAQGKEADFIFISIGHCRRNKDGSLHKGISEINRQGGFKRLNVLFTRARCKNFIVISFNYRELKGSDNEGVKRLYEYIDYAVNGDLNEKRVSKTTNADHAMVQEISDRIEQICNNCRTVPRIGSENIAVDIAVSKSGEMVYSLGILMPSAEQTPQEAVTKMVVLERAGWSISPVSPIYFLAASKLFVKQLKRDIQNPTVFSEGCTLFLDTEATPDTLFSENDFPVEAAEMAGKESISPLTEKEFLAMDMGKAYKGVFSGALLKKTDSELDTLAKAKNTEAHLLLLIRMKNQLINGGKRRALLSQAFHLYTLQKEKKAGYLFAQLLRIGDDGSNADKILKLLKEAQSKGIGGN